VLIVFSLSSNTAHILHSCSYSQAKGYADAQYNLALMYGNGRGVIKDYTRAHMWWSISASQGIKDAAWNRDIVGKIMTPAQIKKAQELARECVAKNYKDC